MLDFLEVKNILQAFYLLIYFYSMIMIFLQVKEDHLVILIHMLSYYLNIYQFVSLFIAAFFDSPFHMNQRFSVRSPNVQHLSLKCSFIRLRFTRTLTHHP